MSPRRIEPRIPWIEPVLQFLSKMEKKIEKSNTSSPILKHFINRRKKNTWIHQFGRPKPMEFSQTTIRNHQKKLIHTLRRHWRHYTSQKWMTYQKWHQQSIENPSMKSKNSVLPFSWGLFQIWGALKTKSCFSRFGSDSGDAEQT